MKRKSCPLCGSEHTAQICRVRNTQVFNCRSCLNAWSDPPPVDVDYRNEDFHGDNFAAFEKPNTFENLPPEWRQSILMQVDILRRSLPEGSAILELGCGEGLLLEKLSRRGFNTTGIEPSRRSSERARNRGLNVITDYFPSGEAAGPFDAVILSHVLEHVADPRQLLLSIKAHYPAAKILLTQTNFKGVIPRFRKSDWYAWAVHQHFWHFSAMGLEGLARSLGYQPEACEYSSLCHTGRMDLLLARIAALIPSLHDQFHLLLSSSVAGGTDSHNQAT